MAKQRVGYFEDRKDPEAQCSRCRLCELICAFHHHRVGNPRRGRIKVVSLGKGSDIPVACLNCGDAPCMNICPTGALYREGAGRDGPRAERRLHRLLHVRERLSGGRRSPWIRWKARRPNATSAGGTPSASPTAPPRCCRLTDADLVSRKKMRTYARSLVSTEEKRAEEDRAKEDRKER